MKQLHNVKRKLPLFLLIGILMLCFGFVLINCGKGPQSKIINSDSGQFAIDFSGTSSDDSAIYFVTNELMNRQGTEVTVEAWVKRNPSTTLNGTVFTRDNKEGVLMWVKDNEPKFAIRRLVDSGSGPTSTDFIVESGVTLAEDTWHHIAGVLVNAVHSHPSSTSCTPAAMAETPHLDIYVDGQFKDCATTGSRSMAQLTTCIEADGEGVVGAGSCAADTIGVGVSVAIDASSSNAFITHETTPFNGVIDEVRYWTSARTSEEINTCINQELVSFDTGVCGVNNSSLAAYMPFNEGAGSAPNEWTGLGSGSKESPGGTPGWEGGWVSGAPITRKH